MSKLDTPKLVTAIFSFKGKNNDELCFKKGDIITITQVDDGGWWEGTLNDKTGWFPSNYVKEYRSQDGGLSPIATSMDKILPDSPVHQKLNRDIVVKDIVDSERVNVAELQGLVNNFMRPLESSSILKKEEYKQLLGNIYDVLEVHQRLLANLEAAVSLGPAARIGNLFLTLAPRLKSVHTAYCNNHPQAVCILDRYRDELNEFMEHSGAITPGILVLTTGLSKPFRRLDKYSAMLQELERYTEKNHPDRGDTQRSIVVYREIMDRCSSIRKQRELALQILTIGVKGWEGEELSSLGEIIHVGAVTLAVGIDRKDRYFVLFPTTLLVLSTSSRMSSFIYEGKLPLTGINVVAAEDTDDVKNAFEISGPMIESIMVLCITKEDRQRWIDLLIQDQSNAIVKSPSTSLRMNNNQATSGKHQRLITEHCSSLGIKSPWSLASIRPAPPVYSHKIFGKMDTNANSFCSPRSYNERQFENDAIILKVIESYCNSSNTRLTIHSNESNSLADNESLRARTGTSSMPNKNDSLESYDRILAETVRTLKNQMTDLQSQMSLLTKQLDEERRSRLSSAVNVKRVDGSIS